MLGKAMEVDQMNRGMNQKSRGHKKCQQRERKKYKARGQKKISEIQQIL